jgi:hypothetical protein
MTTERKADLDAQLAALEDEIWLALKQGALPPETKWTKIIHEGNDYSAALLTIVKVTKDEMLRMQAKPPADLGPAGPSCRMWRKAQNLPYLKSLCEECGPLTVEDWKCWHGIGGP